MMKTGTIITLGISFLMLGVALGVKPGQSAPAFECKDINGKVHRLGDYEGKIIVIEAFNYGCPFVKYHYNSEAMQELQKTYTEKGIVWLIVNSTNPKHSDYIPPEQAKALVEKLKIKATAYLHDPDGKVGKAYDLRTTPHMVVIDKEGKVVYTGAIDDTPATSGDPRKARNYVKEVLDALLEGKQPTIQQTKPYGCTVKYAE